MTFLAERTRTPAPGLQDGEPGQAGEVRINGEVVDAKQQYVVQPGDIVLMRTPGGGGYGPVSERDSAAVETDARRGLTGEAEAVAE